MVIFKKILQTFEGYFALALQPNTSLHASPNNRYILESFDTFVGREI